MKTKSLILLILILASAVHAQRFGSITQVADTVSDLATLTVDDGQKVQTLGYNTINDGGGNTYGYDSSSVATVDGGFVLNGPGGIGRYIAVDQTVANVRQFGAVGDGVADDSAEVQAALSTSAKSVVFGTGVYLIQTNLTSAVADRVIDLGGGTIQKGGAVTRTLEVSANGTRVTNGVMLGDGLGTTDQLWFDTCSNVSVDHLRVSGSSDRGIAFSSCSEVIASDLVFSDNHKGGTPTDSGNLQFSVSDHCSAVNIVITESRAKGISFSGGSYGSATNITYHNTTYQGSGDSAIYCTEHKGLSVSNVSIRNALIKLSRNTTEFQLSNVHIESTGFRPLYLQGARDGSVRGVTIISQDGTVSNALAIQQHPTAPVADSSGIVIQNLSIHDSGLRDSPIVLDANTSNITFRNLLLESSGDSTNWAAGAGFIDDFAANTVYENCILKNTGTSTNHLLHDQVGGIAVRRSVIEGGPGQAIMSNTATDVVEGCRCTSDVLAVRMVAGGEVRNCVIESTADTALRVDAASSVCDCSVIGSTIGLWISGAGAEDCEIYRNDISGTTSVNYTQSTTNLFHHNIFAGSLVGAAMGTVNPGDPDFQRNIPSSANPDRKRGIDSLADDTVAIDFDTGDYDNDDVTFTTNASITLTATRVGDYNLRLHSDAAASRTLTWTNANTLGTPPASVDDTDGILVPIFYDGTDFVFK